MRGSKIVSDSRNYLVNVRCPHCDASLVVAVSGFGGELATRTKECKKCGQEFFVHLLASTSPDVEIPDGRISELRLRMRYLREERKRTLAEQLLRHEQAVRLNQEALEMARAMRDKAEVN